MSGRTKKGRGEAKSLKETILPLSPKKVFLVMNYKPVGYKKDTKVIKYKKIEQKKINLMYFEVLIEIFGCYYLPIFLGPPLSLPVSLKKLASPHIQIHYLW